MRTMTLLNKFRQIAKAIIQATTFPVRVPVAVLKSRFKKNNICMFHSGRCGSTVIGDLLGKHPKITWSGELYSSLFLEPNKRTFSTVRYPQSAAVKTLRRKMYGAITRYYGFEVKNIHIEQLSFTTASYLNVLQQQGFDNFIVLERRNYLRIILSYTAARKSGIWHIHRNKPPENNRFELDLKCVYIEYLELELIQALNRLSDYFREVRTLMTEKGIQPLNLYYEDDIQGDPGIAYKKICAFVKLNPGHPSIRFTRTNPHPIRELVINFDELVSYLSGTEYEWMVWE